MATSKGIKSVVICVLILGVVLEQVQVEGKSCCRNTLGRNCYNSCRVLGGSQKVCASTCDCIHITGPRCPRDYPSLNLLPEYGEPDATKYCTIGCMSSICDNIDTVSRGPEIAIDMKMCSNRCIRFCNNGAIIQSVGA
ncbi:hypothetical protein ACQJBY_030665 [Aegilops geniculata]